MHEEKNTERDLDKNKEIKINIFEERWGERKMAGRGHVLMRNRKKEKKYWGRLGLK